MAHGDRFNLTIKEFGQRIVIKLSRGKAEISKNGRTVTINYPDSKVRNIPKGAKGQRKKSK